MALWLVWLIPPLPPAFEVTVAVPPITVSVPTPERRPTLAPTNSDTKKAAPRGRHALQRRAKTVPQDRHCGLLPFILGTCPVRR